MKRCYHQNELKSASTQHRTVEHSTAHRTNRQTLTHKHTLYACIRVYHTHTPKWQFKCMNMGSLFVCYAYLFIFFRLLPLLLVSFECVVVVVHVMWWQLSLFRTLTVALACLAQFSHSAVYSSTQQKKQQKPDQHLPYLYVYLCTEKNACF